MVRDRDAFTKPDGQDPAPDAPASATPPVLNAVPAGAPEPTAAGTQQLRTAHVVATPPAPDTETKQGGTPWRELPWLTLLLAVGIVAALAFIAGVLVEKHHLQ
ncbi:hypothetical protein ACFYZ9_10130 [Streptomyces sp. NPDC001691]|uniref:hypothetical protein n=1 Tax=Streptomyces sp. NPDC001691 TaxID=3364600 RepID=UPI0036ADC10E